MLQTSEEANQVDATQIAGRDARASVVKEEHKAYRSWIDRCSHKVKPFLEHLFYPSFHEYRQINLGKTLLLWLKHVPRFLIPLPLVAKHEQADRVQLPSAHHALAHLNGMRGFAAFIVFLRHISFQVFDLGAEFGTNLSGHKASSWTRIADLPILRLIFAGRGALSIFFVLSGYVLSVGPMRIMRSEQPDSLHKLAVSLTAAAFKRPFRLLLPCMASTFIAMLEVHIGLWENARLMTEEGLLGGEIMIYPPREKTLWAQFNHWRLSFWDFCFVWRSKYTLNTFHYDLALWTIPLELRCSMFVFVTLLATARLKPAARMTITFLLILRSIDWVRWDMMCYWAGMLLAEIDLIREAKYARLGTKQPPPTWKWQAFWFLNSMSGWWLLSYPESRGDLQPGFQTLSKLIPKSYQSYEAGYWWASVGVIQLVWSTNHYPSAQRFFKWKVFQYLGLISYPLYLMHWSFITAFTFNFVPGLFEATGRDVNTPAFIIGWFFLAVISMFILIWVADLFWRGIEIPCGRFVRWLENKCLSDFYKS